MVCSSVLAKSLHLLNVAAAIRSTVENGVDIADAKVKRNRIVYVRKRYTKVAEMYHSLCSGDAVKIEVSLLYQAPTYCELHPVFLSKASGCC